MKHFTIIALLFASATQAQQVMSGAEFDEFSRNTTMYFTEGGLFYGSEQFLPNRRTIWRAEDGSCVNGKWAEVDGDICFIYDIGSGPHCWEFITNDTNMTITNTTGTPNDPPLVLELSGQDTRPILCTGPEFGV